MYSWLYTVDCLVVELSRSVVIAGWTQGTLCAFPAPARQILFLVKRGSPFVLPISSSHFFIFSRIGMTCSNEGRFPGSSFMQIRMSFVICGDIPGEISILRLSVAIWKKKCRTVLSRFNFPCFVFHLLKQYVFHCTRILPKQRIRKGHGCNLTKILPYVSFPCFGSWEKAHFTLPYQMVVFFFFKHWYSF